MKYTKGQFEYSKYKKKIEAIKTIVLFAIPIAIFLMGYYTTHTKANLLTIVAVLGFLPASKMLISLIMNLRVPSVTDEDNAVINASVGALRGLYNIYFTSYDCNYYIAHMVVTNDSITGYTNDSNFDENGFKKHLEKHMKLDGITGINIKIFNNLDTYVRRLNELNRLETELNSNQLIDLLMNISL